MATRDEDLLLGLGMTEASDAAHGPGFDSVRDAVIASGGTERGSVMKAIYLDDRGKPIGEWASAQIPEDPFAGKNLGLQDPPFSLEQLVFLAEQHPVHSAALEQKAIDIAGKGWEWKPKDEDDADEDQRDEVAAWFETLAPDDMDMHEVVQAAELDHETIGWGLIEVVRDPQGIVQKLYHVPGHTVRAHKDGVRLCQVRGQRKVWFRRWGLPDKDGKRIEVDANSGSTTNVRVPANDMLVIKKTARRSTWYGIPGYVSGIGWITLALAARDDNLFYFANRREPRWLIVLSNLADDPNLEEDLRRALLVDLKQPHRNLILPITGPGKVDFQNLSGNAPKDGTFPSLSEMADKRITIAHRVPADRIANSAVGPLGGNSNFEANRVYKDGVVTPGQEILNKRLRRFISVEWMLATGSTEPPKWNIAMDDLDIDDDRQELDMTVILFHGDVVTLGEARAKLGLGPLMKKSLPPPELDPDTNEPVPLSPDEEAAARENAPEIESPYNDMLYTELPGAAGTAPNPVAAPPGAGGLKLARDHGLDDLERSVRVLLHEGRETQDRLAALSDE